jgi:dihydrofolate reductase
VIREPHEVPEEGAPLFGRNPVLELLRTGSRRVEEIAIISEGRGPALHELLALAKRQGVKISYRTRDQLTAMAGDIHHQGVVARVAGASYASLGDLLEIPTGRGEPPFFLALDQVQDPRNLGAVLRTAEATGVHGVIVPKHHAAGLTGAAAKSAMGAAELIGVARETNLVHALEILKKEGVWTVGAVPAGGKLPWHLPADLKRFKELTLGHHVIMGRKTFESIGKPLPGRQMIVVTHNASFKPDGCLVAASVQAAITTAQERGETEAFVIGGAEIYTQVLDMADRVYLTQVHAEVDADTFFPEIDQDAWVEKERSQYPADDKNQYVFTFRLLERKGV